MVTLEQFDEFRQRFGSGQAGGVSDATFLGELRAKVASAEVLVEALYKLRTYNDKYLKNGRVDFIVCEAIATYDKLSEVKHDTK